MPIQDFCVIKVDAFNGTKIGDIQRIVDNTPPLTELTP